jgi:hypothetical protein
MSLSNLEIRPADLSDTLLKGEVFSHKLDQLSSLGKAATPTIFVSGPCESTDDHIDGCRFWIMVADNVELDIPDIVSFVVVDATGKRLAYGTGLITESGADINDTE